MNRCPFNRGFVRLRVLSAVGVLVLLSAAVGRADEQPQEPERFAADRAVDFDRDVRPILAARCAGCHNDQRQESGLSIETREALLTGGYSGEAAIEGDTTQEIASLYAYNQFGQLIKDVDPEANVHSYEYYPENDPDGDGLDLTPGIGTGPFGYLKQVTRDAVSNPDRNSDSNSVVSVDIGFQPIKPFTLVMPRFIHGSRRRPNYGAMRFHQNTFNDSPHVRFIFIEQDSGLGGI
ncbi:MAG: hypothetical protein IIA33_04860 [Planctomycetes bacterium]|nr:hypothetical protein [Planctomycetota bacterium]